MRMGEKICLFLVGIASSVQISAIFLTRHSKPKFDHFLARFRVTLLLMQDVLFLSENIRVVMPYVVPSHS